MKYTPGPWTYDPNLSAIIVIENHQIKAIADFGKIYHHAVNAHLIAAAPELLHCLKVAVTFVDDPILKDEIQQAISKAEGREI